MTERLEGICERITAALEYVPFARYDDTTKLAENALGELLAALEAAEADARQAEGLLKIASAEDLLHAAQCLDGSVRVYEEGNAPETAGMVRRSAAAVRALAALGRA